MVAGVAAGDGEAEQTGEDMVLVTSDIPADMATGISTTVAVEVVGADKSYLCVLDGSL